MQIVGTLTVDVPAINKTPNGIKVTDLCGRIIADVQWYKEDTQMLDAAKKLARERFGDVLITTRSGVTFYADELGL
jgi:hypothetical protein